MLRGNYLATVDEKGRVKIPSDFLDELGKAAGSSTSPAKPANTPGSIPMKAWEEIEKKLANLSSHNRAKAKVSGADELLRPGGRDGRARAHPDSAGAAGIGTDEGRSGRGGTSDVSGSLEPRAIRWRYINHNQITAEELEQLGI